MPAWAIWLQGILINLIKLVDTVLILRYTFYLTHKRRKDEGMNIIEALSSGKPFRRPFWNRQDWHAAQIHKCLGEVESLQEFKSWMGYPSENILYYYLEAIENELWIITSKFPRFQPRLQQIFMEDILAEDWEVKEIE